MMRCEIRAALCLLLAAAAMPACPAEPGLGDASVVPPPRWRLAWSDDFDAPDPARWESIGSGKFVSRQAQRLGRWEVRLKLPAGSGTPSTISLRPDGPSPPAPEIVIMQARGDRPTVTSSAFHWTAPNRDSRETFAVEQQTAVGDELVSYADGFHTFAGEWVGNQLRFYVDDMHHGTFYDDEVGYMLPNLTEPMRLVIDNAIVDWVRVYALDEEPGTRTLRNGGFDEAGGSPAGWHIFGNRIDGTPNVLVHPAAARDGTHALKIAGESTGETNYTGVAQGISIAAGERVRARLSALVRPEEALTDPNDRAWMKIEFYKHWGSWFSGPAMLGVEERVIADATTPTGAWKDHELEAVAPEGAVEARLTLVFGQNANAPGAVTIDAVEFSRVP